MADVAATNARELPWPALAYISKSFAYNTTGIDTDQTVVVGQLPEGARIFDCVVVTTTAFDAASTNVISIGTGSSTNEYLSAVDITNLGGAVITTAKRGLVVPTGGVVVYAKYGQTGTPATTGAATIVLSYITRVG